MRNTRVVRLYMIPLLRGASTSTVARLSMAIDIVVQFYGMAKWVGIFEIWSGN